MHESLLAKDTLELILNEAKKNGASKVVMAKIRVADTENIDIDSFKFHIKNYAHNTIAESMNLEIEFVQIPIICSECGNKFYVDSHIYICEKCGSDNVTLGAEEGIVVEYIEVETDGV
ncbi:MAG: hydrogenase maturation nickel metallochaperone HypA [Brevinematia bacterium]